MTMKDDKLLTPREFAELVGVTPRTVTRWIREGKLPAVKVGRVWRIHRREWRKLYMEGLA